MSFAAAFGGHLAMAKLPLRALFKTIFTSSRFKS